MAWQTFQEHFTVYSESPTPQPVHVTNMAEDDDSVMFMAALSQLLKPSRLQKDLL